MLQPHHQEDSTRDDEVKMTSGRSQENFICRHHVVFRVKLYVPTEGSFPIPLIYIDVTRTTDTTCDVGEKMDDWENVDGDRELSDAWTGFTRYILLNERPLDGYTWSGERLTRKQTTSRLDNVGPDLWKHMSDASKRKAKQKMGYGEAKARQR